MSSRSPKILIVDDDVSSVRIIADVLSAYDRRFATTAEMALLMINSSPPDLVLADADMPGMTGFDLCEAVKADPATSDIPVVLVSAHDAPRLIEDALLLGASDYVIKPLDARRVLACVRAQLRRRRELPGRHFPAPEGEARLYRPATILLVARDGLRARNVAHVLRGLCSLIRVAKMNALVRSTTAHTPIAALVDMTDPLLDGLAACRTLRASASGSTLYIISLVTNAAPDPGIEAMTLGVADTLLAQDTLLRARITGLLREMRAHAAKGGSAGH